MRAILLRYPFVILREAVKSIGVEKNKGWPLLIIVLKNHGDRMMTLSVCVGKRELLIVRKKQRYQ